MDIRSRFFRSELNADYVALDWESGVLRAAAARVAGGHVTLQGTTSIEWSPETADVQDVAATAEVIRKALRGVAQKSSRAIIVLPREAVLVRKLDLPNVPDNELPDLVRLQAATKLATPVDRLALDYLPLTFQEDKTGRSVLLLSMEQERLQAICKAVEAAGLEPVGCVTSSISVADLALRSADPDASAGLALVVYQHRQRLELSALLNGQLIFSYSLTLPDLESAAHTQPLMAELSRVLVAVRQAHHDTDIGRVLFVQEGGRDEPVLAALRDRFGDRLRLLDAGELGRSSLLSGVQGDISAAALGALVTEAAPTIPTVDFLRPRKAVAQANPRQRQLTIAAAAAGVLLLIGGLVYYHKLSNLDEEIQALATKKQDLQELIDRPQSKAVIAAAQTLNAWSEEKADPLAVISEFQSLLPGTERLYFTSLTFSPVNGDTIASLAGHGHARKRQDVGDLFQRLSDRGYQVTAKPTTISSRNPDYPIEFDLNIAVRPAPKAKPAGKTSAVTDDATSRPAGNRS
jgi:outer membrane murein-binding lipoprotein Lpp